MKALFRDPKTRHATIDEKRRLLLLAFPNQPIGRTTVHKIQHKLLRFSYKRITKFRPKNQYSLSRKLKRLIFIKKYLEKLSDEDYLIVVLDEAGFGSKNQRLRNYGYALKNEEVVWHSCKIQHNLTIVAAMSTNRVEYIQLFHGGGTTKEFFACYMQSLVEVLKQRYPEKKFLFIMDNLSSHKTSEAHRVYQDPSVEVLFLPAHTSISIFIPSGVPQPRDCLTCPTSHSSGSAS